MDKSEQISEETDSKLPLYAQLLNELVNLSDKDTDEALDLADYIDRIHEESAFVKAHTHQARAYIYMKLDDDNSAQLCIKEAKDFILEARTAKREDHLKLLDTLAERVEDLESVYSEDVEPADEKAAEAAQAPSALRERRSLSVSSKLVSLDLEAASSSMVVEDPAEPKTPLLETVASKDDKKQQPIYFMPTPRDTRDQSANKYRRVGFGERQPSPTREPKGSDPGMGVATKRKGSTELPRQQAAGMEYD